MLTKPMGQEFEQSTAGMASLCFTDPKSKKVPEAGIF
jgi:hypothetical protein